MVEEWTGKFNLHHLNLSNKCIGKYTFHNSSGKSAIDHILVNDRMVEGFKGMFIDEEKELLNISDHCLVKAWFNVGPQTRTNWKKTEYKRIEWILKDQDSLEKFERDLLPKIGKKTSFDSLMRKIKSSQNKILKKDKRIRIGLREHKRVTAAEWVDIELIDNIKVKNKLSRRWRIARKQGRPENVLKLYEKEYKDQQVKTSIMSGEKKGLWEKKKIEETKKDAKKFWNVIKELLGKSKERVEEAFVYTEEGEKKNIEEVRNEYMDEWKKKIYQKNERIDFSFWYGK